MTCNEHPFGEETLRRRGSQLSLAYGTKSLPSQFDLLETRLTIGLGFFMVLNVLQVFGTNLLNWQIQDVDRLSTRCRGRLLRTRSYGELRKNCRSDFDHRTQAPRPLSILTLQYPIVPCDARTVCQGRAKSSSGSDSVLSD